MGEVIFGTDGVVGELEGSVVEERRVRFEREAGIDFTILSN